MLHSLIGFAIINGLGSLGHAIHHTLGESGQSARYDLVYSRLGLGLHVDSGSESRGNKEKLHHGGFCNRGGEEFGMESFGLKNFFF